MPTVLKIITGSLMEIGVNASGELPQGPEGSDALDIFNDFVDALGVERLAMHAVLRTVKTLTSTTASYTIGSGGDINIVRPMWIQDAMLIIDTGATYPTEIPIDVLDDDAYAAWPSKTLQNTQSSAIYFDHAWAAGLGRIYPLPIPNVGTTQLVLYTPSEPIAQVASLDTVVTFPPGVRRMLRKNLAIEFAPSYPGCAVSPLLLKQAMDSKAAWKRANVRPMVMGCDPALVGSGGSWNINTGTFKRR